MTKVRLGSPKYPLNKFSIVNPAALTSCGGKTMMKAQSEKINENTVTGSGPSPPMINGDMIVSLSLSTTFSQNMGFLKNLRYLVLGRGRHGRCLCGFFKTFRIKP